VCGVRARAVRSKIIGDDDVEGGKGRGGWDGFVPRVRAKRLV
jgi:hypothetical protein